MARAINGKRIRACQELTISPHIKQNRSSLLPLEAIHACNTHQRLPVDTYRVCVLCMFCT